MVKFYNLVITLLVLTGCSVASGEISSMAESSGPGLITFSDIEYKGAFRLPLAQFGDSDLTYAEGQIAYNSTNNSLFIVGHKHQQAIAEFSVPELSTSSNISNLKMSPAALQNFSRVLDRAIRPDDQPIDTVGGMLHYQGKLIVNAYEYYDGPADNTLTTLVINDSSNLANSSVDGFFGLQGRVHAAGWMSPVPTDWQDVLGGQWITGNSSYIPIISRLSVGPSAFIFDPADLAGKNSVPTITLLDFSLDNPLHKDLLNQTHNKLWNHLSRAIIGFIPHGTSTYVTVGFSGGHNSGVCYKCIPKGKTSECGGFCARDKNDYHLMYWLWDVNQLAKVRQGKIRPHQLIPYEYGIMDAPFPATELGGGSFDPETGQLFLTLQNADTLQTVYGSLPIIIVYSLK